MQRGRGCCKRRMWIHPTWRVRRGKPICLAERLVAAGYVGMRVRSFAPGAGDEDMNLVMWHWGDDYPSRVATIDEEGRLTRK